MSELFGNVAAEIRSLFNVNDYPQDNSIEHIFDLTEDKQNLLPERFILVLAQLSSRENSGLLDGKLREQGLEELIRILELKVKKKKLLELASKEAGLATSPEFVIDQSEKSHALNLCAELRNLVSESQSLPEDHKVRLFRRISAIEIELHKAKGNFDVILGGMSDFGEALGKLGKDVKPLFDRIQEIAQITRRGSKEYEKLPRPEDILLLTAPDSSDEEA